MSSTNTSQEVAFLIDAPLQSWGASSLFNRRDTEAFPTKSALVGLIVAAMGIDKNSDNEGELLLPIASLNLKIYQIPKAATIQRMVDFHTIGGGYDPKRSKYEKLSIPHKASGGPKTDATLTKRTYLNNARFIACFKGDAHTIDKVATALENPVWGVWFGRKNCIPALPLSPIKSSSKAAQHLLDKLIKLEKNPKDSAYSQDILNCGESWEEPENIDERSPAEFFLSDQPVSFKHKKYHSRAVVKRHPTQ